jgi:hypothetical protein
VKNGWFAARGKTRRSFLLASNRREWPAELPLIFEPMIIVSDPQAFARTSETELLVRPC